MHLSVGEEKGECRQSELVVPRSDAPQNTEERKRHWQQNTVGKRSLSLERENSKQKMKNRRQAVAQREKQLENVSHKEETHASTATAKKEKKQNNNLTNDLKSEREVSSRHYCFSSRHLKVHDTLDVSWSSSGQRLTGQGKNKDWSERKKWAIAQIQLGISLILQIPSDSPAYQTCCCCCWSAKKLNWEERENGFTSKSEHFWCSLEGVCVCVCKSCSWCRAQDCWFN